MADSTGWGSGGTSVEQIVGPSVGNANCNTTDPGTYSAVATLGLPEALNERDLPGVDFFFELNTALQQCR